MLISVTGRLFVAEDSPVYINEAGEGVTDLAYYHPFVEAGAQEGAAYNPFDTSSVSAAVAAGAGNFSMGKNLFYQHHFVLPCFRRDKTVFK